jgi:hypothetical protein
MLYMAPGVVEVHRRVDMPFPYPPFPYAVDFASGWDTTAQLLTRARNFPISCQPYTVRQM